MSLVNRGRRSVRGRGSVALAVAAFVVTAACVPAVADVPVQVVVPVQTGVAIARYSVPADRSRTLEVPVAGRLDIPATGVGAVVLNVTALGSTADGFVTVWPSGRPRPLSSNLNPTPGLVTPNLVVVALGDTGAVSFYSSTGTPDLLVDVLGWFPTGSGLQTMVPERVLDTRSQGGPLGPAGVVEADVGATAGVAPGAIGAAVLNVTAPDATAPSFVTVWPTGQAQPGTSSLNPRPGLVQPNLVVTDVGADGKVRLGNAVGRTNVVVDLLAWFPPGAGFHGVAATRVFDTRQGQGARPARADAVVTVPVLDRGGVPATGVAAVSVNVTAVGATTPAYVTVWPSGRPRPVASNLNLRPGLVVANASLVPVGADGAIALVVSRGTADLVVDVTGWFADDGSFRPMDPTRLVDTRVASVVEPDVPWPLPPVHRVYTYSVATIGAVGADVNEFMLQVQSVLDDPRGWRSAGYRFQQVPSGGELTLWLAEDVQVPSFGACSVTYSCYQNGNVVLNDTRWRTASPAWSAAGGSLLDYRRLVTNHEFGHAIGFGHAHCSGPGQLAAVMQQQSISLEGCTIDPWPLARERASAASWH
jgi:hypothetical protein